MGLGEIILNLCCDIPQSGQKHLKDSQDRQPVSLKHTLLAVWNQHPRGPHDGLVGQQAKAAGLPGSAHYLCPTDRKVCVATVTFPSSLMIPKRSVRNRAFSEL